jgi:ferredoxin--NADP+ reductase
MLCAKFMGPVARSWGKGLATRGTASSAGIPFDYGRGICAFDVDARAAVCPAAPARLREETEVAFVAEYDISEQYKGTVRESSRITPEDAKEEVRHIVLSVNKPGFDFKVGQPVGVLVPGPHEFGNPYHVRLYTIASSSRGEDGSPSTIALTVRRCSYIDEFSGEEVKGVASNFLCDRRPGDEILLTGPFESPFEIPDDPTANLLMVGMGTGIAPFRAFVKQIYDTRGCWQGKVRLFFGARSGLEMLYLNDENNDLANYYDQATFKAFEAVSPRPAFDVPAALDEAIERNGQEVWEMINDPDTFVYVAGPRKAGELFAKAMAKVAGSAERWERRRGELRAGGRYAELLY